MATAFFITHSDVVIDPSIPIPDWPLNERGRARMHAMTSCPWVRAVRRIFASNERKAREAAQLPADGLGLDDYGVIANLHENDRSATGFLSKDEFETTANAFFTPSPCSNALAMPRRRATNRSKRGMGVVVISILNFSASNTPA